MSNFGRLGSAMVQDGLAVARGVRAQDQYAAQEPQRELAGEQASISNMTLEAEYDLAGGKQQYAMEQAKLAKQRRNLKLQEQQANLQLKRAKASKTSAMAAKAAMKKAPGTSSAKNRFVPLTSVQ